MSDKKEELTAELQMLDQQIKQIQAHLQKLDEQLAEIVSINTILDEMGNVKKGDEALVPVANGVYIKTKIDDAKKFIVNVGANTTVTKTIPEVREMIVKQQNEIVTYRDQLMDNFKVLVNRVEEIHGSVKE